MKDLGAFHLTAKVDTFFKRFLVCLLCEPHLASPTLDGAMATATLSDETQVDLELSVLGAISDPISGELEVRFDGLNKIKNKDVKHIDVESTVRVPFGKKMVNLDTFGKILAKPQRRNETEFTVIQAAVDPRDTASEGRLVVILETRGAKRVETKSMRLLDADKKKVKPTSRTGSTITLGDRDRVRQTTRLEFPARLAKTRAKCMLLLGDKKSKPLKLSDRYVGKLIDLGELTVRVNAGKGLATSRDEDFFDVELDVTGGYLPVGAAQLFSGKKPLKPVQTTTSQYGNFIFSFPSGLVAGKEKKLRFRIAAPTSMVRHTIATRVENPDLDFD